MRQHRQHFRTILTLTISVLATLFMVSGCKQKTKEVIKIGSKSFTENTLLGEIASLSIAAHTPTKHKTDLGGPAVLFGALQAGDVDVYPEYTGTISRELLRGKCSTDLDDIAKHLAPLNIKLTPALGFNNTYAMGMRRAHAEKLGIKTISDLRNHPQLKCGFSSDFIDRKDGWPGVKKLYQLPQKTRAMEHQLCYTALKSGAIDVMDLYSTDAEIKILDLVALKDDKAYFPRYDAIYLYRADLEQRNPAAVKTINDLAGQLPEADIIELNSKAQSKRNGVRITEKQVIYEWLKSRNGNVTQVKIENRWQRIWHRSLEHLFLVCLSLLAATFTAIPIGYFAYRKPRMGQLLLGFVGIVQTIPSLALLVFMIPLLGTGVVPAVVALYLYSLLPIVRGTYLGFAGIPKDLKESAEALGLSSAAKLRLVELPLALPAILSGLKTSAVINIGTATLGAAIGAGGYGLPIFAGIRRLDNARILEGAIPAALLALAVQGLFEIIERYVVSKGLQGPEKN